MIEQAREILLRHCQADGLAASVLPGLHVMRFGWASLPLVSLQSPCLALVLQGTKSVSFAGVDLHYSASQYLLASVGLPATSRIIEGSPESPTLALGVDLDLGELQEATRRCARLPNLQSSPGLDVFDADAPLLDAVTRLLRLLDTPEDVAALAPLIRQEILYRLLTGPAGGRLMEISRSGSPASRISDVAAYIRQNYSEGLRIADLARRVGMSPSSLHQHFKAITGMTPVQYQKQVRLLEARRSLFFDGIDVGEASIRAGYQSHSQFSKDYRQYFGRLPKADVLAHTRGDGPPVAAYAPVPAPSVSSLSASPVQ